ncbi:MAG: hypothetical protein QME14_06235 [Methanobacteriaceae archaeon]|nr:hypothetical protein [Methanobacteriaceae archaeon]
MDDDFELKELFEYEEKASRIELFVRIFYAIPVYIVLILYGIIAGICMFIHMHVHPMVDNTNIRGA